MKLPADCSPGPWHVVAFRTRSEWFDIRDSNGKKVMIGTLENSSARQRANATLAAIAPEFYDACKALITAAGDSPMKEIAQAVSAITKALAKAEGAL